LVRDLPKVTRTLIPHEATSRRIDELVRERLRTRRALYTLDLPVLEALRPDLIVTQALCDVCAMAEEEVRAAAVTRGLRARVETVAARTASLRDRPRVAILEWIDPPFSCGHWSPELVRLAGGVEGIGREGNPSRTLYWDEVTAWQPEGLFLACCGFTVELTLRDLKILRSYPGWADLPCVRARRVYVINGSDYFSRRGPRLVDSLEILAHALHPDVHPLPPGLPAALAVFQGGSVSPWEVPAVGAWA
jgi:iron complex transport system substrate-binding protein